MKIPRVAYMFWHGREFTYFHYLTIDSFLFHNPDIGLTLYTVTVSAEHAWATKEQSPRITSDVDYFGRLKDIITIVEIADETLVRYPPNIICDMVRWKKLYEHGGYWIDTDILFLQPLDRLFETLYLNGVVEDVEFVGTIYKHKKQWTTYFPIGIIGGAPGNRICGEARERVRYDPTVYNACGPDLLRSMLRSYDYAMANYENIGFYEPGLLYPYQCYELDRLFAMNNGVGANIVGIHWFFGSPMARTYINHWQACMESNKYCLTDCTMDMAVVRYYRMRQYKMIVCVIDAHGSWLHTFAGTIQKFMPPETLFSVCTVAELKQLDADQHESVDIFLVLHPYEAVRTPRNKTVRWLYDETRPLARGALTKAPLTLVATRTIERSLHELGLPVGNVMYFPFIPDVFPYPYPPTICTKPVGASLSDDGVRAIQRIVKDTLKILCSAI